jgi:hypothetical protein
MLTVKIHYIFRAAIAKLVFHSVAFSLISGSEDFRPVNQRNILEA